MIISPHNYFIIYSLPSRAMPYALTYEQQHIDSLNIFSMDYNTTCNIIKSRIISANSTAYVRLND